MKTYYVIKNDDPLQHRILGCSVSENKEMFRQINPFSIEWTEKVIAEDKQSAVIAAKARRHVTEA